MYDHWRGIEHISDPVPEIDKIIRANMDKVEFFVFTARAEDGPEAIMIIEDWCMKHYGRKFEVFNVKGYDVVAIWDDRAVAVEKNTGKMKHWRDIFGGM
jgi:hypothetical protein